MARDLATIEDYAELSEIERPLLLEPAAPIVLLDRKAARAVAPAVAPAQSTLGFMLPYTPLHHLLFVHTGDPLVLTSGNITDEPQCIGNEEARAKLGGIADAFLMHDRDIVNRLDDSVARVMDGKPRILRRARGYAPAPLSLPEGFDAAPRIMAMGAELKSTFCLLGGGLAIVSQHIGDLEEPAARADYRENLKLYREIFRFTPEVIAADLHPDYFPTVLGEAIAREAGLPLEPVQHHHAHIAAVLAEAQKPATTDPVLGLALDGLGFGEDGGLWGGEFLIADYRSFRRVAAFTPVPLIGGAKAMREPWRNALAHLHAFLGRDAVARDYAGLEIVHRLKQKPVAAALQLMERGVNAPLSSSAGRLFDAAAALLAICFDAVSYEGQAAIELEALAAPAMGRASDGYRGAFVEGVLNMAREIDKGRNPSPQPSPSGRGDRRAAAGAATPLSHGERDGGEGRFALKSRAALARLDWTPLWRAFLDDLAAGADAPLIAAKFHAGLAAALADAAAALARLNGCTTVVLCGGVFQNKLLLEETGRKLARHDLEVLSPALFPAGDGAISLGQAMIAAARRMA